MSDQGLLSARCAMLSTFADVQFGVTREPDGLVFVVTARTNGGPLTPPVVTYVTFKCIGTIQTPEEQMDTVRKSRICSTVVYFTGAERNGQVVCTRCGNGMGDACKWMLLNVSKISDDEYKFTLGEQGGAPLTSNMDEYDASAAALYLARENLKFADGVDHRDSDVKEMVRTLRNERDVGRVATLATQFQLLWLTQHINPTQVDLYRYLVRAPISVWYFMSGSTGEIITGTFGFPIASDDGQPLWEVSTKENSYHVTFKQSDVIMHVPESTEAPMLTLSINHPIKSSWFGGMDKHQAIIFTGPLAHVRIVDRSDNNNVDVYEPRVLDDKQSFFSEARQAKVTLQLSPSKGFSWVWKALSGTDKTVFVKDDSDYQLFVTVSGDKQLSYHPFGDFSR